MPRAGAGGGGGAAAVSSVASGGGVCGNLFDAMPELMVINPELLPAQYRLEFKPRFERLNQLNADFLRAMGSGPSISDTVRTEILARIMTPDVRDTVRPILKEMFDGQMLEDITQDETNEITDCILNGLLADLDILRIIQMVAKILIKSYYGDGNFRLALAATFVVSTVYTAWNIGMGQIVSLGIDGGIFVLSALSGCYQFINDPAQFMVYFVPLLGDAIPGKITDFINLLTENIMNPAVFATLIAQSNIFLMGRVYGEGNFRPYDDLAAAAVAGGVPLPPPAGAGGAFIGPPLPGPPGPANDICLQMFTALKDFGGAGKEIAKRYFLKLIDMIRKLKYIRPGQIGSPEDSLYHQTCHLLTSSIGFIFEAVEERANVRRINLPDLITKILLDELFPSNLRGLVAMGDEYNARNEVYLLAHRIKSKVMVCITASPNKDQLGLKFERVFPIFGSDLTAQNVEFFFQSNPEYVLSRYNDFLARLCEGGRAGAGGGESSQDADYGCSQDPKQRLSSVFEEFNRRVHVMGNIFATDGEKEEAKTWFKETQGWVGRILTIPDRYLTQGVKGALACEMAQRIGDIASTELRKCASFFEQPAQLGTVQRHTGMFNFPPPERIWTDKVHWVLKFISEQELARTPTQDIMSQLMARFGYSDLESFGDFFRLLMLRCKLSSLMSPQHNTFDFFIMDDPKDDPANPDGVGRLMLNVGTTGQVVNGATAKLEKLVKISVDVLSKPIEVPRAVERAATGATTWVMSLFARGGSACQAVEVMPSPPESAVKANEERNASLIAAIDVQDAMIDSVMNEKPPDAAADNVALVMQGADLAAEAVELVVLPGLLNELADEQDELQPSGGDAMDMRGVDQSGNLKRGPTDEGLPESKQSRRGGKSRRKSRKNSKKTTRRNKSRKSSKTAKKTQQLRARRSSRHRRSSRNGRK